VWTRTLDHGFDRIIDKSLANTLDQAIAIRDRVDQTGLICCLTHNANDGAYGIRFVDVVLDSSAANGAWRSCPPHWICGNRLAGITRSLSQNPLVMV